MKAFDVLRLVKETLRYKETGDRKLESVKQYFGIESHGHRVLDDCFVTYEVFKRCLKLQENYRLQAEVKFNERLLNLNETEKNFISELEKRLEAIGLKDKMAFDIKSDNTINFMLGNAQIGRVKLRGRKYKMQLLDQNKLCGLILTHICPTPHPTEDEIKQRFLAAFNIFMGNRDELLANFRLVQEVLCDCSAIDAELEELRCKIEIISELTRKVIYENARFAVNQDEFNERHQGYMEQHMKAIEQVAELKALRIKRCEKHKTLQFFVRDIEIRPLVIEEFVEKLWLAIVDKVSVLPDSGLVFTIKDGTDIEA